MNRVTRRWCLLAMAGTPVLLGITAQALSVRLDGDYFQVTAPNLDFLTGKPLQRLRDGSTVNYLGQLSILTDDTRVVRARSIARFAVSHDIWEEMSRGFSVTLITPNSGKRPSIRNLTPAAAQSWCLDQLKINLSQVPSDRPIWVRLEIRSEDKPDRGIVGEPGISLSGLIAIFSRPVKDEQFHWYKEDGPFNLADLRKARS